MSIKFEKVIKKTKIKQTVDTKKCYDIIVLLCEVQKDTEG